MNLHTEHLDIATPDGSCDSLISCPSEGGPFPGVLFLMDAFGLRPYLNEMVSTLASHGYFVLAPNLLYRQKRSPVLDVEFPLKKEMMPEVHGKLRALIGAYNPEDGLRDIGSFLDFLSHRKEVKKGKFGMTGYCMGGGLAIRAAARYPARFAAVASFHAGNLATEAPNSPHLLLKNIQAELYLAHADQDQSMPAEQIARLQSALESSGLKYHAEIYPGAAHGFSMKDLPAYNEGALKRHWSELPAFFSRRLG